jgi:hypothetical protein
MSCHRAQIERVARKKEVIARDYSKTGIRD